MDPVAPPAEELGRGRSGVVYLTSDEQERPIARKVFTGEGFSKIVLYLLTGAPNPYSWNQDAVRCAHYRRVLLGHLVRYWFPDRLSLPHAAGWDWDEEQRVWALSAGFVKARQAPLDLGRLREEEDPLRELVDEVMRPLQKHLIAAGMDGLAWQAGLGNPVAANNFLLVEAEGQPIHWSWIDVESGVPALFPLNPLALFRFYLPLAWRLKALPFDDVDVPRLREYLATENSGLTDKLGEQAVQVMLEAVDELATCQTRWKSLNRLQRSVEAARVRGRINDRQAEFYRKHGLRWNARLCSYGVFRAAGKCLALVARLGRWLGKVEYGKLLLSTGRFLISERFREHMARKYVAMRIRSCHRRQMLDQPASDELRRELRDNEASAYITDFGVHLAIKPFAKVMQWWVFPAMYAAGSIDAGTWAIFWLLLGPFLRTVYTLYRAAQALLRRHQLPWVAFLVGMAPVVGNAAYPAQLAYSSAGRGSRLPRFILHDTCATMGRAVPIWGGRDTLIEHWFSRIPRIIEMRARRKKPEPASA
jgi:hypothetical protein